MDDKITLTKTEIASIFTEWLRRYEKNPDDFAPYGSPEEYGTSSADYFCKLAEQLRAK